MAHIIGTISDIEKVLYKDILIDLQSDYPGAPLGSFRGEFDIPFGGPLISAGESCELTCSDGRRGHIFIESVRVASKPPSRVTFVTSGPFV
jgi:hypothetical protein